MLCRFEGDVPNWSWRPCTPRQGVLVSPRPSRSCSWSVALVNVRLTLTLRARPESRRVFFSFHYEPTSTRASRASGTPIRCHASCTRGRLVSTTRACGSRRRNKVALAMQTDDQSGDSKGILTVTCVLVRTAHVAATVGSVLDPQASTYVRGNGILRGLHIHNGGCQYQEAAEERR